MCGIAGILRIHPPGSPIPPHDAAIPEPWLDILDESIKHRGPDGQGRFRDRAVRPDGTVVDVALVHRRLSIIDHACGAQPMVSLRARSASEGMAAHSAIGTPDTSDANLHAFSPLLFHGTPNESVRYRQLEPTTDLVAVVFNGCIYNHRELRKELQAAGHTFETDHSDTEVLLHGWREWRTELPGHLDGMFAFLVWGRQQGKLLSARDRFGEKPMYFRRPGDGEPFTVAFSSTVPSLLRIPAREPELTAEQHRIARWQIGQWIRFGSWGQPVSSLASEVFPGFHGVTPAESAAQACLFPPSQTAWTRWTPPGSSRTWNPPVDRIDKLIQRAVASRLEADVPIGTFLSGGVDSSLITVHAHRHRPDLRAFTVRMPDQRFDESSKAAAVARHIGISHITLECNANPAADLVFLIRQLGLPFGDSSLLPTYWVCRAAAQQVKVALSGDGADELFGGYRRYLASHYIGMLGPFRHLLRLLAPIVRPDDEPDSPATRRSRFVEAAGRQAYQDLLSIFPSSMHKAVGIPQMQASASVRALAVGFGLVGDSLSLFHEWATRMEVWLAMNSDLNMYLPNDILRKTDTASMAVPLEVRAPFLERALVQTVQKSRIGHLMPRGQRKGLLRAVARMYLPPEIVDRPKQGFAIPIGEWFRTDYGGMKQLLLDHLHSSEPWGPPSLGIDLNMKFVRQMLDEHMGSGVSGRIVRDHSQRLYMLLVLSIWAKWMGSLK